MQLGGQAPNIEDMIAQRLQAVSAYNPAAKNPRNVEDAYMYALHELPKLQGIAGIRSQDKQLQEKNLAELADLADKFHKDYRPEVQENVRPVYAQLLKARAQMAGATISDDVINMALKSPDLASTYNELFNDPQWSPQERQAGMSRLGQAKTSKDWEDVSKTLRTEKDAQVLSMIQSVLPEMARQLSPGKPLNMQEFLTNPQVKEELGKSPIIKRVFNSYINDKANHEALANMGFDMSAMEKQKKSAQGLELTGEVKDALATMKGPDGKPLMPSTVASMPNGTELIAQAKNIVFNNKLDISKHQGFNAVIAKAEGERNIPLVQIDGMKDVHFVNKNTEMPVDRLVTTMDQMQKGGGEEKFAVMNVKSYEAFMAAKEADGVLGQYLDISRSLTNTPGANLLQVAAFYAKTKLGVDNPGVGLEALRGSVLRMARAMQGSSQSLSNLDANAVAGMLPSEMDTVSTALKRLEISAKLIQNMKDTQLGKVQPAKMLEQIESAKKDIARMQGTVITDGKQQAVIPKGQSVPKGWKVVQ